MKNIEITNKLLSRLLNWKINTALTYAEQLKDEISNKAYELVKEMAEKYGNCGWNEGGVFDELRDTINIIVNELGYYYNEDLDTFCYLGTTTKYYEQS